jgi:hypothetical protein
MTSFFDIYVFAQQKCHLLYNFWCKFCEHVLFTWKTPVKLTIQHLERINGMGYGIPEESARRRYRFSPEVDFPASIRSPDQTKHLEGSAIAPALLMSL